MTKISWMYLRLLMTHLGFDIGFINWVTCCISNMSSAVLINGVASPFFSRQCGLHQGGPLSPLLLLFAVEGLSQLIHADIGFINWVMSCISNMSFAVLINGVSSPFFSSKCDLCRGCPCLPYCSSLSKRVKPTNSHSHQKGRVQRN